MKFTLIFILHLFIYLYNFIFYSFGIIGTWIVSNPVNAKYHSRLCQRIITPNTYFFINLIILYLIFSKFSSNIDFAVFDNSAILSGFDKKSASVLVGKFINLV